MESFSSTMIKLVHHCINVLIGDVSETPPFGKVLPDQTTGVFVQSAFPGMAGIPGYWRLLQGVIFLSVLGARCDKYL
jgi:hypothetical protein